MEVRGSRVYHNVLQRTYSPPLARAAETDFDHRPGGGPRVWLFRGVAGERTVVSNVAFKLSERPAALPRPELRPGRPAA